MLAGGDYFWRMILRCVSNELFGTAVDSALHQGVKNSAPIPYHTQLRHSSSFLGVDVCTSRRPPEALNPQMVCTELSWVLAGTWRQSQSRKNLRVVNAPLFVSAGSFEDH